MTGKFVKNVFLISLSLLAVAGCGHRKNPTGGEKDTVKPEILSISPAELSNIQGKDIEVVFSKPIERSTIMSGLYIYPPILQKKYKWDKNVLTIKILEKLDEDVNYFFTFNTKITGERKNNLDKDYTFIFASGELAVNKISGKIVWEDPADSKLKVNICLLAADSTFIMNQNVTTPAFEFKHLNDMDHIFEAFADQNKNNKYDYGKEPHFYQYVPAAAITAIQAEMAYEDTIRPNLKSVETYWDNLVQFTFDEPIEKYGSVQITSNDSLLQELKIIADFSEKDKLEIITSPMDTLQYIAHFYKLLDLKNNVTDSTAILFDGSVVRDTIPPEIISLSPRNGETIETFSPEFVMEFNEIIPEDGLEVILTDVEKAENIPLSVSEINSKICKVIARQNLENYSTYEFKVKAKDYEGNLADDYFQVKFIVIVR